MWWVVLFVVGCAWGAPIITVTPRNGMIYNNVTQKVRIQGSGFRGDGTNVHLKFIPPMAEDDFKVQVTSETAIFVGLKPGKSWPVTYGEDGSAQATTFYLTEFKDDKVGDENLLEEAVVVGTTIETPTVMHGGDKVIYMSATQKFNINGTGFRAKDVKLTFEPPLERDEDYILQVKSSSCMILNLKTGKKWRTDGDPGPLKLRRIDTGAGPLRVDAKYGGVTVAEVQVDLGAHGVTVDSTPEQKVYQSSKTVQVQGDGFSTTGPPSSNTLKWGNSLRGKGLNYTITSATSTNLRLELEPKSQWRMNPSNLPGPLMLLAVNAGAGLVPVGPTEAKKGRVVATVFEDPAIDANPTKTIYMTHTHELWITGRGFTRNAYLTSLTFEPPLVFGVDYVASVSNRTHVLIMLMEGKKWAPVAGVLRVTSVDTGAGPVRDFTPVVVANVASDADESKTGVSVSPTQSQQLYQTAALKKLVISGAGFCEDPGLEFQPALQKNVDYAISKATDSEIHLELKPEKKWRFEGGSLFVTAVTCPNSGRVELAYGSGIVVAKILSDPTVDASERKIYNSYTKKLVVQGLGFALDGTEVSLKPTSRTAYTVVSIEATEVVLALNDGKSWLPAADASGGNGGDADEPLGEIVVTKLDTGAGEVVMPGEGVVVAKVFADGEGPICDDSCEWAMDGVCDDGSNSGPVWQDDDYGGFYAYDDYYERGYYYEEDDDFLAPVCEPGTDCSDCGDAFRGPDEVTAANANVECTNTCPWADDGYCDDIRTSGICDLGTDCKDCGPASASNFTKWDDDGWWDDDASYWDDDYDFESYTSVDDEPHVAFIQSTPNPKTRKKDLEEQQGIGGIFMMILEGIVVGIGAIMCTIGSWFAFRFYKGEKLPFDLVPPDADFEGGSNDKTTAAVEITPDVTYSGAK
mmetsp:Transcript_32102/g.102385  ORF Transcript_32102/g.102385 Transcript_32102/m.102385 type:complete len:916 (+) Transcript_32102:251-2998(+)